MTSMWQDINVTKPELKHKFIDTTSGNHFRRSDKCIGINRDYAEYFYLIQQNGADWSYCVEARWFEGAEHEDDGRMVIALKSSESSNPEFWTKIPFKEFFYGLKDEYL